MVEVEPDFTVAVGGSAKSGKRLLNCDFLAWEQEQFGAAVVADLRTGESVLVEVFWKGLAIVHLGQPVEWIVDEQTFRSNLRQPSVNEILADGGVFWIVFVVCGDGAFRI